MDKYSKIKKYIMAVFLLSFMGCVFIINIVKKDSDFSEMENRILQTKPEFSLSALLKGGFTEKYEKYISDQFFIRNKWIQIKSTTDNILGKKESNEVYRGKDGYLFQKYDKKNLKELKEKVEELNKFSRNNTNIKKYFLLAPTATKILENKLPYSAPVEDQFKTMDTVKSFLDKEIKFVDVRDTLKNKNTEYIYYRTDHHWTTKGAFYAYENLAKIMEIKPHSKDYFNIKTLPFDFYGSLHSKSGYKDVSGDKIQLYIPRNEEKCTVEYCQQNKVYNSLYFMKNQNKKDKYSIFLGGNQPLIKISTNMNNKKKLLIVKDSYANSLIPFLTGHYSEIYVVDLRYYDENLSDLIKAKKIKEMLMLYNVTSFTEDISLENINW